MLSPPPAASALGVWTDGNYTWGEKALLPGVTSADRCRMTLTRIVGIAAIPETAQICVYDRPNFRYGMYTKKIYLGYTTSYEKYFLVSLGTDKSMYVVENLDPNLPPLDVEGRDDLHFVRSESGFNGYRRVTYIVNFPSKLERATPLGQATRYRVVDGAEQPFIPYAGTSPVVSNAVGVSDNGNWMAVEITGVGLVRINMDTRKIDGFSNRSYQYGRGNEVNLNFRISNDGTKIAAFHYNISPFIDALSSQCMKSADLYDEAFASVLRTVTCPTDNGRLREAIWQHYADNLYQAQFGVAAGFSNDGSSLYFDDYVYAKDENNSQVGLPTIYRTPLRSGLYHEDERLEYLALGDSFTSGEGDIEKKSDGSSYYLPGTANKNECHQSSRSYPFLLREEKGVEQDRMYSVACSGAQILPDYMASVDSYLGQGSRLRPLSVSDRKSMKEMAITGLKPGIVPQLEFIKEYQPKTVTLMGGGNDVGFGDILKYCASPTWEMSVTDDTCGYAIDGHPLRKALAQSIVSQYDYTLLLLRKIKQASPEATVYIVGYPSFISEEPGVNCFNSAALDSSERAMINQGVTFMNTMLESAATSMGMTYIDIQDTLEGGRLCEGSEYVTGISDLGPVKVIDQDTQEAFHPNAKAHEKITQRIMAQGFQVEPLGNSESFTDPVELEVPAYFGTVEQKSTTQMSIADETTTEQETMVVYMSDGSLSPGSDVTLTMFSDTIELGTLQANGKGGVSATLELPASINPGQHVLTLQGLSPSGEDVEYFQFVTVISAAADDKDGDGIKDEDDTCLFIKSWIDEATQQDICLTISATSQDEGDASADESDHPSARESRGRSSASRAPSPDLVESRSEDSPIASHTNVVDEQGNVIIKPSPEVLGAQTTSPTTHKFEEGGLSDWLVLGSLATLSTLVGRYGIVRVIRRIR